MKEFLYDWKLLLVSIPSYVVSLYCCSIIAMNLMANKIIFNCPFVAIDGGILISWIAFLSMDIVVKRYGGVAAVKLNLFAVLVNVLFIILFTTVAHIQIEFGLETSQSDVYTSFNSVFSCTWFVLLGSTVASITSSVVNSLSNVAVGKLFTVTEYTKKFEFFIRSYVSTFFAQFIDNLVFAVIVFIIFAPIYWGYSLTLFQCIGSAIVGSVAELLMEVVFSPFGYKLLTVWEKEGVGTDYISNVKEVV